MISFEGEKCSSVLGLALPFAYAPSLAADLPGQEIRILDGASLETLHNHHPERIHLNGIDCHEKWITTIIFQLTRLAV
jgi:hypothetical protein